MVSMVDVSDPTIARALANERRQRLWLQLSDPATISQLASRLGMNKGSVSHHLRILHEAGLVIRVGTKTVRGGTEIYFERVPKQAVVADDARDAGSFMVDAIAAAIRADRHSHLHHRSLRLTRAQATQLRRHLDQFIAALRPAPEGEQTYGVVVGLYRSDARPGFGDSSAITMQ